MHIFSFSLNTMGSFLHVTVTILSDSLWRLVWIGAIGRVISGGAGPCRCVLCAVRKSPRSALLSSRESGRWWPDWDRWTGTAGLGALDWDRWTGSAGLGALDWERWTGNAGPPLMAGLGALDWDRWTGTA